MRGWKGAVETRSLISSFTSKLALFKRKLGRREFYQFPSVAALRENGEVHDDDIQIFCDHLDVLQKDVQERFQDILKMKIPNWFMEKFLLALPSSYLVERGFSVVTDFQTKKSNRLQIDKRGNLRLFLTNTEPNVDRLVAMHQPHPSH
ncbi:SCAN domain-containing protein 3 [Trichinella spiralis]|uniref:SCAN domain-containing protein 3 n=1 Tax=Trichinella spiralis TaxID=6334 RepID=A0A0V1AV91_TRISP|nr:SCAN domain-containing protein 3 [Trichinella spiralis]